MSFLELIARELKEVEGVRVGVKDVVFKKGKEVMERNGEVVGMMGRVRGVDYDLVCVFRVSIRCYRWAFIF